VTGSGAAQSLRPVCVARRERLRDFGLIASTSAVPPREPSRRKWRLAARCGFPAAHIPRRVRQASMRRRSAGTHPKWKKTKRPGSFAESGPLETRERQARRSDAAASRTGAILGLAMLVRRRVGQPAHQQRDGARARTRAGEGFGVAKGDPAVHDGVLVRFRFEAPVSSTYSRVCASCKRWSPFQATARSVNSLYDLRKGSMHRALRAIHAALEGQGRRPARGATRGHKQIRWAQRKLSCLRGRERISRIRPRPTNAARVHRVAHNPFGSSPGLRHGT